MAAPYRLSRDYGCGAGMEMYCPWNSLLSGAIWCNFPLSGNNEAPVTKLGRLQRHLTAYTKYTVEVGKSKKWPAILSYLRADCCPTFMLESFVIVDDHLTKIFNYENIVLNVQCLLVVCCLKNGR